MALIETKLGLVDERYLDQRATPVDDAEVYGVRIEVWPKSVDELAQLAWTPGDAGHPNCHHGAVTSAEFLTDTIDQETGQMGPGTLRLNRQEFHPPNCVVTTLLRAQREEPIAVYGRIYWEKVNPFEETPDTIEVDLGGGKIETIPTAGLTRTVTHFEDEREFTYVEEYRDSAGRIVKRSPNVKTKQPGVAADARASAF